MFLLQDEAAVKEERRRESLEETRVPRAPASDVTAGVPIVTRALLDGTAVSQLATACAATKLQWGAKNIVGSNICNASVEGV